MLYGKAPKVIGPMDIDCNEMMYWLYLPIKMRGNIDIRLPKNLNRYSEFVNECLEDFEINNDCIEDYYVYLTAKTMFVNKNSLPNRPGWHSDGFMTDDINYIWSNNNPTLFWLPNSLVELTQDHKKSLKEMKDLCRHNLDVYEFQDETILKLDQFVIHKVNPDVEPCIRTFLKLSISKDRYNLIGNSINHELEYPDDWVWFERKEERNCPIGKN